MAYGLTFEGKLGNSCFSDKTPSIVFMGKATATSTYGPKLNEAGHMEFFTYNSRDFQSGGCSGSHTSRISFRDPIETTNSSNTIGNYIFSGGVYYNGYFCARSGSESTGYTTLPDTARTVIYQIEAYDEPIVFTYFNNPANYGGLVIKTEDSGSTGSNGWTIWNLTVLLYYATPGNHATAVSNITLYCFSKIPPNYVNNSTYGLHIRNASGNTMFHSDYNPCQIREMMTITTGSNPDVDFSSTLLDSSGTTFNTISKPCYLSQDWGRVTDHVELTFLGSNYLRLQFMLFPYSIRYISGDDFEAYFGQINLSDYLYTSTAKGREFTGASTVVWPVIDGADYD